MTQDIGPPTADHRAQENIRSLIEFNGQRAEIEYARTEGREVKSVGIVGAGTMGASIAACTAAHGLPVVISDADPRVLAGLPRKLAAEWAGVGKPATSEHESAVGRSVRPTTDTAAVARCDLVLEAVVEKPAVKRQVFADLEPKLEGGAILASNTSTLPITRLAAELADPSRFCGLHFFHPVGERPLVEVVRGLRTSDGTIATAVAYVKAIGKIPLVVRDGPGFVVNRLLVPYAGEAMQLLLEGVPIEAVEQAAADFGMPLGPLALLDQLGLDTVLDCGWVLSGAYPDTVATSPLLVAMVKAGRLGQKSGAGFFAYRGEPARTPGIERNDAPACRPRGFAPLSRRPPDRDPAVDALIDRWAGPPQKHTRETITARLFLLMLLEATRILQEQKVADPRLVDLGAIFGLGFPEARGGLLFWADTLGAARVVRMLQPFESLGPRARPTPMLLEMAEKNRRFYDTRI